MDFREILGTSNRRRLSLIELLYYKKEGLPSDQLLNELDCSLPILLNDVKLVNEQQDSFFIEKYKGLYRLTIIGRVSIGKLYAETLINSPEFQIIEQLLYEECDNITSLAERLFLSVSNTQRYLKKAESALAKAGIRLHYRPLRLEGKESVIRHFFYRYYIEKQNAFENVLPMLKDYQFETIEKFIVEFININKLYKKYIFQKRLIYNIYVSLWRIKNGHEYPKEELRTNALELPSKEVCNGLSSTASELFRLHLTDDIMRDCLWLQFSDCVIFSNEHRNNALQDNPRYRKLFNQHMELVERYNGLIGEAMGTQQLIDLNTVLMNDCYMYEPDGEFFAIIRRSRQRFIAVVSIMHKHAVEQIDKIVREFVHQHQIYQSEDFIMNYIYLLLTGDVDSLELLAKRKRNLRLLLLSDLTPTEEEFIAKHIKGIVYGNYEIFFFESVVDGNDGMYTEMLNYDALLTTGSVEGLPDDFPVIMMDPYVTPDSIIQIQNLVNEL
ncbi:hypothetical protein NRIC_22750 [Enterococcus florum]|uniref:Mga helix-turn-helix domain-containing protein n=1 Tax=Enterococcus florum TaxID=2480627 RepID=A0A4P5PCX1_9ENTE|nr:helix-turn-helix domain-containing protein [Enterococcus florum]GCF94384.1 hypothetical protein NRIC_22750 [Enterococcus florum]